MKETIMTVANVFANSTATATSTSNGTLAGTQQLTNTSATITETIMSIVNQSTDEEIAKQVQQSMSDMSALDKLIASNYDLSTVEIDFLKALDEVTIDGMLKSQQSKRSRCKAKEMTVDNYKSMMTAAIAEILIRQSIGKEKGSFGGRQGGSLAYTEARLAELSSDQEALRKEIRNVQSKKSIMKSKAGFTEADERWLALLVAEEQLKGIRQDGAAPIKVVDTLRDELKELLGAIEEQSMTAKQLKELVATIKLKTWSDVTNEEEATDVSDSE